METFKSLPLAGVRQNHQPQDRSTIYRIGSVSFTIFATHFSHRTLGNSKLGKEWIRESVLRINTTH